MSDVLKDHTIQVFTELFPWDVTGTEDFTTKFSVHSSKGVTILRATLEDVNGLDFEEFEWELREK
jgi:hypothetical protein